MRVPFETLFRGGGREANCRSGTENIPGIIGLALAAEKRSKRMNDEYDHACTLKEILVSGIKEIPNAAIIPKGQKLCLTITLHILLLHHFLQSGEVMVRVLNDRGFSVATGAACHSRKASKGRVLEAMGIPKALRDSVIRISTGFSTKAEEIREFLKCLESTARDLSRRAAYNPGHCKLWCLRFRPLHQ